MKHIKLKLIILVAFLISFIVVATFLLKPHYYSNLSEGKNVSGTYFYLETPSRLPSSAPFKVINKSEKPILSKGNAGEWDSTDLLNPSVIIKDKVYYNYYSGYDGSVWRTGLATSMDGLNWQKPPFYNG